MKTLLCTVLVMVMVVGLTACGNKVGDIEMKEGESAIYKMKMARFLTAYQKSLLKIIIMKMIYRKK
ncbi:MAG: hypothetical protein ACLT2Z_01365 [Eubacterium sp.]